MKEYRLFSVPLYAPPFCTEETEVFSVALEICDTACRSKATVTALRPWRFEMHRVQNEAFRNGVPIGHLRVGGSTKHGNR
jgi:hypothetical protein